VRGKGFMIGVEFVKDAVRKTPWDDRAKAMRRELFVNGLLMHTCGSYDNALRFMAPLTIEDPLLERGLAVFEQALSNLDAAPAERSPVPPVSSSPARPHPAPVEEPGLVPPHRPAQSPPPPGRSLP
jgi:Aminotransferase class-III